MPLVTYSSFVRRVTNASTVLLLVKVTFPETSFRDRNPKILPENVATSNSGSSVPMQPPDTEVTSSPEN